jgi:arginyl-tRNA synthetase
LSDSASVKPLIGTANPFRDFRQECERVLRTSYDALQKSSGAKFPDLDLASTIESPPDPSFGQLASSVPFELSRVRKNRPIAIAKELVSAASVLAPYSLIQSIDAAEPGYVNFKANFSKLTELTIHRVLEEGSAYGLLRADQPRRIIVEHTSANPARPIHIGTAKNAIFGDTLVHLLSARGHSTQSRFYIDDAGRQVAIMAYGYKLLGEPVPTGKPDHFIGKIYSITSALVEIEECKKRLALLKKTNASDLDIVAATKSLDEWVGIAADLQTKDPAEFDSLAKKVSLDTDPTASIAELVRRYEKGESEARNLGRRVAQLVLAGFEQTLQRAGIRFDEWDWESDLLWTGRVSELLDRLKETGYTSNKKGAWELDVGRAVENLHLKEKLGVSPAFEVPSLTLTRSDGTSLYTTRDMAYSLFKFEKSDQVITVIGVEQSLAQFQLRVALWILGHKKEALNYLHYPYGLVELEGQRMSARRGRYVTFDQVLDESLARAVKEVEKRSPDLPAHVKQRVAERISTSAIRFTMLSVEAAKSTNFVWDRVLNFETNSAPFINYAYTRGLGILRKIGQITIPRNFGLLTEPVENELVLALSKFPDTFVASAEGLDPTQVCLYANELAQRFHEFYEKADISHLVNENLKAQRAALVIAVRTVLQNAASLLGLQFAERM